MLDFKQIERKLRQNISTCVELKKYYDSIFHEGIFLSLSDFEELNRLFNSHADLINNNI